MSLSRRSFLATGALASSLFLAACQQKEEDTSSPAAAAADGGAFPVTIKHAFGETTIEAAPERVVCLAWNNAEPALALGVAPLGLSLPTFALQPGEKLYSWVKNAYESLGVEPEVFSDVDGIDFEAVAALEPDLILAPYAGYSEQDYEKLTKIAPTILQMGEAWALLWRDQLEAEAKALGLEAEAKTLLIELEGQLEDCKAEYKFEGVKAAFLNVTPTDLSSIFVYLPKDPRVAFLKDMGFDLAPSLDALAEGQEGFYVQLSAEEIDKLQDVELAVMYGDKALLESLKADALLGKLDCIAKGKVALVDLNSELAAATTPSALSIPANLKQYSALLHEALTKEA